MPPMTLLLLAPFAASAQSDDDAYCGQLYGIASKYFRGPESGTDLGTQSAGADCSNGHAARGIDYLEKKLRANGFTLPKRS